MAAYTRDEINFHVFLNAMRKLHNVTLEQVCEGLCSVSMMKRIESGERLPEKLMRDRMLARMGVLLEGYEDYLPPDEYELWCLRQDIIKSIEKKNFEKAENNLKEYKKPEHKNVVELQFYNAMYFMLLKQKDASLAEQREVIERAIKYTIADIDEAFHAGVLLSNQEIYLLIEYIWVSENENTVEKNRYDYFEYYKVLLNYIEQSQMNVYERVKIYPKGVYYACQMVLLKIKTFETLQWALEICDRALDLLGTTEKLYYFVELLEVREKLIREIQFYYRKAGKRREAENLLQTQKEMKEVEVLLKELYKEYQISPYVENDCFLYRETGSYSIGDVIKRRRQMFGMTKEQLCEGICSEKTLTRIESKKVKAQIAIVRELFGRLGLCEEYTCARVITSDYYTLELADKLSYYENGSQLKEWKECLSELKVRLCMDIAQNQQFVLASEYLLELESQNSSMDVFVNKMLALIELTISLEYAMRPGEKYLTKEEEIQLYNIGTRVEGENPYMAIIEEICVQYEQNDTVSTNMRRYELLASGLCSYHGNIGEYEISNERSRRLIKEELLHYRMSLMAYSMYNNLWNNWQERTEEEKRKYLEEDIHILKKCCLFSKITKRENACSFYERKILECEKKKV